MSHIPQFGDATTSPAGDAASPTGDVDVSAGDCASVKEMIHLQWETIASPERDAVSPAGYAVSPEGYLLASPNFGICDTTHLMILMYEFFLCLLIEFFTFKISHVFHW